MIRPLHVARLALAAALAFTAFGMESTQAGSRFVWPPGQIGNGHFVNGARGGGGPTEGRPHTNDAHECGDNY